MLAAIDGIQNAVAGKTQADYVDDWLLRHAIQRGIEVISEASRLIPPEIRTLRAEVPWDRVRGIGNVLRHEYHALSDRIIWAVVVDELPRLKEAIVAIQDHVGDEDDPKDNGDHPA